MLKLISQMKDLDFSRFLNVYSESVQSIHAENALYDYLLSVFSYGGYCAVWVRDNNYVSALRLEPYRDGFLIAGLETVPKERGRGYATALMEALCGAVPGSAVALYSHVKLSNQPSVCVHKKCGFLQIHDYAVFLDGSVDTRSITLCKKL